MTTGPTRMQLRALLFIAQRIAAEGVAPSHAEIAAGVGASSRGNVHRLVRGLVARGLLAHQPGLQRSLTLTDAARQFLPEPIMVDLPDELDRAVRELATKVGVTAADVIVEAIRDHTEERPLVTALDPGASEPAIPNTGRIYFIQVEGGGPIKIGISDVSVLARIATLQTACPWRLEFLGEISGGYAMETWLHLHFESFRMQGEWFAPAEPVVNDIKAILAGTFAFPESLNILRTFTRQTMGIESVILPRDIAIRIRCIANQVGVAPSEIVVDILRDALEPTFESSVSRETGSRCEAADRSDGGSHTLDSLARGVS